VNRTREKTKVENRLASFVEANERILGWLAQIISSRFGKPPLQDRKIVAFAGPGCVGKSTLAEALSGILRGQFSYESDWIDLDGYLIEKAKRETPDRIITGYNPKGFELAKAERDLKNWLSTGEPFVIRVYDKVTSRRDATRRVRARDALVIEGVCAFNEALLPLSAFRIFLTATKEIQYANRRRREVIEMGRSLEQIEEKFRHLYPDYERYVLPTKRFADLVLRVEENYRLARVEEDTVSLDEVEGCSGESTG